MPQRYALLLAEFEQYLRVERNLAERTRRAYLYDLSRFQAFLTPPDGRTPDVPEITTDRIRAFLNHLQRECGCKSATLARRIASLRAFFQFAVEREVVETSPAAPIRTPKQPKKLPVYLVAQELARLLQTPDAQTPPGLRDRAILTTLAFTGLRLSELVGIDTGDVDLLNRTVRVTGKGRKERIVPLNELVMQALNAWLDVRDLSDCEALFLNRFGKRLSGRTIEKLVRRYTLKAGIFKQGVSPHKLRHTFATLLHANEVDLIEIQTLMGHANIASTQIYTHTTNTRLRAAVEKIENIEG